MAHFHMSLGTGIGMGAAAVFGAASFLLKEEGHDIALDIADGLTGLLHKKADETVMDADFTEVKEDGEQND